MPNLGRLAAAVEERLIVPTYGSRWPLASIAAHRGLSLPLQLVGPLRRSTASSGGTVVRVAAIGRDKRIAALVDRLFGAAECGTLESPSGLWRPAALERLAADVVLAEVHRWMAPRFRRAGWLILPDSVRWVGDLAEVPGPAPSHSVREDLRKIAKQGFTLVQSDADADWGLFATRMVAAQARARFGEGAWVPSRRFLRELRRVGTLHLVRLDGESVAGMCSVPRGDTVWLPLSGVRDGDPALFRRGASLATLALTFAWAREQGFRAVDAGRTSPFLSDGVQRVKRKWGLHPVVDPLAHVVAVRINSEAVRAAFAREPVLVEGFGGLRTYAGEAL
jgi:hypothetical protein